MQLFASHSVFPRLSAPLGVSLSRSVSSLSEPRMINTETGSSVMGVTERYMYLQTLPCRQIYAFADIIENKGDRIIIPSIFTKGLLSTCSLTGEVTVTGDQRLPGVLSGKQVVKEMLETLKPKMVQCDFFKKYPSQLDQFNAYKAEFPDASDCDAAQNTWMGKQLSKFNFKCKKVEYIENEGIRVLFEL